MPIVLRLGSWCDVAPGTKAWVSGRTIAVNGNVWGVFDNPLFLRVANAGPHTAVIVSTGFETQTARVCVNGGQWSDIGRCYGTNAVGIAGVGEGFYAAVVVDGASRLAVYEWWPDTPAWRFSGSIDSPVPGSSQGLLGRQENRWVWVDEVHQSNIDTYQLTRSVEAGAMRVGQKLQRTPQDPDALIGLFEGNRYLVFEGLAFDPRITQEMNGEYSVVSRIPGGLWVDITGPVPLGRLIVPPTPAPEPEPEPPSSPLPIPEPPKPTPPPPRPTMRAYPHPESQVTEPFFDALRKWGEKTKDDEGKVPVEFATTAAAICTRSGMRVIHDYQADTSRDPDSVALARAMAKHLALAWQELGLANPL